MRRLRRCGQRAMVEAPGTPGAYQAHVRLVPLNRFERRQPLSGDNERQLRLSMRDQPPPRRMFATLFGAFSLAVFAMGIGLAVYAGIQWLQTARWQPLTLSGLLTSWPGTRDWVDHPRTWLGLHRIFMWVRGI